MKIKVCGMRDPENIHQAEETGVDMMGFIFYPGSSRYIGSREPIPTSQVLRVGVFVNEDPELMLDIAEQWDIRTIQLHGDESPDVCSFLTRNRFEVVKAFPVGEDFDFGVLEPYAEVVDYFLFDTKGTNYGGSGELFDWRILDAYKYDVPFWLSGGIHPGLVDEIKRLEFPMLYAIDVNSGFEEKPGMKNIEKLKNFVDEIQGR